MAGHPLYEVEELLDRKVLPNHKVLYLVRWRGFTSEHDTWEPYSNLQACRPLIRILKKTLRNKNKDANSSSMQDSKIKLTKVKDATDKISPGHKRGRKKKELPHDTKKGYIKKTKKNALSEKTVRKSKFPITQGSKDVQVKLDEEKIFNNSGESKKPSDTDITDQTISKPGRKGIKKRKLEVHDSGKGSNIIRKRKKKLNNENVHQSSLNANNSANSNHVEVNGDSANFQVNVDEKDDDDDDDDSNILYSLNPDCDIANLDDVRTEDVVKKKKKTAKGKNNVAQSISVITKDASGTQIEKEIKKDGRKKRKIFLIDSKKKSKDLQNKSGLIRSASPPPPMFTTVKHLVGSPDSQDPSKPTGNCHQEPVSPEASETYLADVPSSYSVPAEEPHTRGQSLTSRSLSYNSILDSLPDQLHPSHNVSKKNKNDNNCGSSSTASSISPLGTLVTTSVGGEQVERRTSVRSTECAFRYKQIVVKKCVHYTQIWLNTQTVMKNSLNPQVIQEVVSALNSAKYDDSHLVLFSSLGNVFCSGTDLHFLVSGDRKMSARQMADAIRELTKTVITFPKPIIAAVSGAAVGLGVALLALCDVVYASDKASFHLPYSQLSQTPEGCSSFTLPLTLGLPSANELLFGGRKITAMEAYQLGLVSQVFWPTLMMQEVIPRAQNMATCSAKALEATKLLIRSHHRTKMELTNETECNLLLERWLSVDCQRAIEAYLSNEKNLAF